MFTFFLKMKYIVFSAASINPPAFERPLLETTALQKMVHSASKMCLHFVPARQRREAERWQTGLVGNICLFLYTPHWCKGNLS